MTTTYAYTNTLVVIECCACHMDFAVQQSYERDLRRSHEWFYCPAGHRQHFPGKSDLERAREETARAERQLASAEARASSWRDQAETAENRRRAQKAASTRLRNRVHAGVCPSCTRTFQNLARHMATKHAEVAR